MTSFGKTAVEGPGALQLLERACCNRIDRPVGAVVYTQMLDARGGILPTSPSPASPTTASASFPAPVRSTPTAAGSSTAAARTIRR